MHIYFHVYNSRYIVSCVQIELTGQARDGLCTWRHILLLIIAHMALEAAISVFDMSCVVYLLCCLVFLSISWMIKAMYNVSPIRATIYSIHVYVVW